MTPTSHEYGKRFFDYVDAGARRSASRVLPIIQRFIRVSSVLDVGCGRGAWLAAWRDLGVKDCLGVDGAYVDTARLAVPGDAFLPQDISAHFTLSRRFGLVQCLEVAEHIQETRAACLVNNLTAHGDVILFSAAVPGQGGEFHVNEQPHEYWRDKFDRQGYRMFDFLRPAIRSFKDVEPWYRFNTFVFANKDGLVRLSGEALGREVRRTDPIEDFSSLGWRIRTRALRALPQNIVHYLAQVRHIGSSARPR